MTVCQRKMQKTMVSVLCNGEIIIERASLLISYIVIQSVKRHMLEHQVLNNRNRIELMQMLAKTIKSI